MRTHILFPINLSHWNFFQNCYLFYVMTWNFTNHLKVGEIKFCDINKLKNIKGYIISDPLFILLFLEEKKPYFI